MTNSEKELIEKLNKLIEVNLDNSNLTGDEIYRELAVSRSQLFRVVKEHAQLSISLYVRHRKLLKAKELLDSSDLKISEITYQIGIDSPQSFSKYFTQEFGVSPSEYRKNKVSTHQNTTVDTLELEEPPFIIDHNIPVLTSDLHNRHPLHVPKKYLYFGAILAVFMVIALGFYFTQNKTVLLPKTETLAVENTDNSIAVLPFKNLGTPATAIFADGLMEQVHSSLAHIAELKVISKTSSMLFRDSKSAVSQIAHELHVGYILVGSILQIDKKVKVSVELIKGAEDRTIWTKNYDGEAQNVIAFMNKVAKEIAGELHQKLSAQLSERLDKVPTTYLEAYNEYLQGKQLLLTRESSKVEACLLKFDAAIAMDPNFSLAYSNKAAAYYSLGNMQQIARDSSFKLAEKAALTAIRLDAENGMAYAVLANIYKDQNKWEQALTTLQIALKHSPNDAQINYWYSIMLRSIGKFEKAIQYSTKAIGLDPLHSIALIGHIGNCSYARRFDLTQKAIKDGELLFNDAYMLHWAIAFYHIHLEDYDNALKEFQKGQLLNPKLKDFDMMIAYTQAKLGHTEWAKVYLHSLTPTVNNYTKFATVYAGLGDKEQCLKYLEMGAALNIVPEYFKVSPLFKLLHSEKRFEDILQKFGFLNPAFAMQM